MLPTAEGGKANAWLRQKNAGIYVRPRLFSPYVEEAKVCVLFNKIVKNAAAAQSWCSDDLLHTHMLCSKMCILIYTHIQVKIGINIAFI